MKLFSVLLPRENSNDYNRVINRLCDAFEAKEFFAVPIMYWITKRQLALTKLYGERIARESKAMWTMPEVLTEFITRLCRGSMRTWQMNENGKIIPPEQAAPQFEELLPTAFAHSTVEQPATLAAKARD